LGTTPIELFKSYERGSKRISDKSVCTGTKCLFFKLKLIACDGNTYARWSRGRTKLDFNACDRKKQYVDKNMKTKGEQYMSNG